MSQDGRGHGRPFQFYTSIPYKIRFVKRAYAGRGDFDAAESYLDTPTGATTYDYFGNFAHPPIAVSVITVVGVQPIPDLFDCRGRNGAPSLAPRKIHAGRLDFRRLHGMVVYEKITRDTRTVCPLRSQTT